jgi:hypothetical protein
MEEVYVTLTGYDTSFGNKADKAVHWIVLLVGSPCAKAAKSPEIMLAIDGILKVSYDVASIDL